MCDGSFVMPHLLLRNSVPPCWHVLACNRRCSRQSPLRNVHYNLTNEHTHCVTTCMPTTLHARRHAYTDMDRHRQAHMHRHRHRQTGRHAPRQTDRQTDRHTRPDTDRHKNIHLPCRRLPPEAPSCQQTSRAQIPQLSQTASRCHAAILCWNGCDEAPWHHRSWRCHHCCC